MNSFIARKSPSLIPVREVSAAALCLSGCVRDGFSSSYAFHSRSVSRPFFKVFAHLFMLMPYST